MKVTTIFTGVSHEGPTASPALWERRYSGALRHGLWVHAKELLIARETVSERAAISQRISRLGK